jgi:hypothetical protein
MDKADFEILCTMVAARERPPEYAVRLLEDTCKTTGLDWKLRHLYLMQKGTKWMVTLSIDGFRLTGSQDPDYGGQEGPFWVSDAGGTWSDIPPDGPIYAAKVGIKHKSGITTWGVAKFKDYKAGPMWDKFPSTMSAKCAEMLAWRKAFPGRLGNLYGAEEMAQSGTPVLPSAEVVGATPTQATPDYFALLEGITELPELIAMGTRIQADDTLHADTVLKLGELYKARKKAL